MWYSCLLCGCLLDGGLLIGWLDLLSCFGLGALFGGLFSSVVCSFTGFVVVCFGDLVLRWVWRSWCGWLCLRFFIIGCLFRLVCVVSVVCCLVISCCLFGWCWVVIISFVSMGFDLVVFALYLAFACEFVLV